MRSQSGAPVRNDEWLPDLSRHSGVKYLAVADALSAAIERGDLRAGDRVPPQRELAARLRVDLTTITKAYESVRLRGLIEARGRAGSFVSEPRGVTADVLAQVDAGMNMPPELPGRILARAIANATDALLSSDGLACLQYQPLGGAHEDRAAGAQLLDAAGLPTIAEQVVLAAGGQNALNAVMATVLSPGDAVACGVYVYPGFKVLAERLGIRLVPLETMSAVELAAAARDHRVRALYVVPTNDNPTTATLDRDTREAIAGVATREGIVIIEDDAYGALALNTPPPLASLAPTITWYIASVSKYLSPALRVAYLRAPSVGAALQFAHHVHETSIMAPPLNAAIIRRWIGDGTYGRLLGAMRTEIARRLSLAEEMLGTVNHAGHPQGYHVWVPVPDPASASALIEVTRPAGLTVVSSDRFAVSADAPSAVRVSIGGLLDTARLTSGLRVLHGFLSSPAARRAMATI